MVRGHTFFVLLFLLLLILGLGQRPFECKNETAVKTVVKHVYLEKKTNWSSYYEAVKKLERFNREDLSVFLRNTYPFQVDASMLELAKSLKRESVEDTVDVTIKWINENIEHEHNIKTLNRSVVREQDAVSVFKRRYGICEGISNLAVALLRVNGVYSRDLSVKGHKIIEVLYPVTCRNQTFVTWVPIEPQNGFLAYGEWRYIKPPSFQKLILCNLDCWLCKMYNCTEYEIVRMREEKPYLYIGVLRH